ncbi:Protein of unknown function [Cotesia congregata]|uniref:Uncharacterized protein n=1 Tax=Cotesia congregata TaxID=51543 RepID=A0A8J2HAB8_COTCN|nr:Protein of unknown function [Cotesia congregata]
MSWQTLEARRVAKTCQLCNLVSLSKKWSSQLYPLESSSRPAAEFCTSCLSLADAFQGPPEVPVKVHRPLVQGAHRHSHNSPHLEPTKD